MCGRYVLDDGSKIDIIKLLKLIEKKIDLTEIATGTVLPSNNTVVLNENFKPVILKWGIRKWDNKGILINARSESLHQSVFFNSMKLRKCLIIASGFYEFKDHKPYYFNCDKPLFLAGVYNDKREFVILTKDAGAVVAEIHDRSPIAMDKDNGLNYLDGLELSEIATLDSKLNVKSEG